MAPQNCPENTPSRVSHTGIALNGNVVMQKYVLDTFYPTVPTQAST
jgi:hypothetical protein